MFQGCKKSMGGVSHDLQIHFIKGTTPEFARNKRSIILEVKFSANLKVFEMQKFLVFTLLVAFASAAAAATTKTTTKAPTTKATTTTKPATTTTTAAPVTTTTKAPTVDPQNPAILVIVIRGGIPETCTGTLISDYVVVTSTACVDGLTEANIIVARSDGSNAVRVSKIVIEPTNTVVCNLLLASSLPISNGSNKIVMGIIEYVKNMLGY